MRRPIDRLNRGRVPAKGGIFVAPPFAITSPADLSNVVSGVPIAVSGSSPGVAAVNVTGNAVAIGSSPVVGNAWSVPWTPGALGAVALAATDGALNANISVTVISAVAFAFTNPAALSSVPVGTPITVSGTSPSASAVTVTANGVPIGGSPVVGNVWSFSWTPTIAAATTLAATDGTLNANISITVTSGAPANPPTLLAGILVAGWEMGLSVVTESGGLVTAVSDLGPGGFVMSAAGTARPTQNLGDVNFTNGLSLTFDGVANQIFNSLLDLPQPSLTQTWVITLARPVVHTSGAAICAAPGTNTMSLVLAAGAPTINKRNQTAIGNGGGATGGWSLMVAQFANQPTDVWRVRNLLVTGNALDINPGAGYAIGSRNTTGFVNMDWRFTYLCNAAPTAAQLNGIMTHAQFTMGGSTVATGTLAW